MIIPPSEINSYTLQSLIEEFVTRDGTDYGDSEVTLDERVARVMLQLERGEVLIWFDPDTETCTLLTKGQLDTNV
jgi:uncharacterized protein YheU (UPF0270 family)